MHNPLFNFTGAVFVRPALSTPLSRLPGPSPWPLPWRMPTNMSLTWPFALTMAQAPGRPARARAQVLSAGSWWQLQCSN